MPKKVPLDRLRQISKTRRPHLLDGREPDGQEHPSIRAVRPQPAESKED